MATFPIELSARRPDSSSWMDAEENLPVGGGDSGERGRE